MTTRKCNDCGVEAHTEEDMMNTFTKTPSSINGYRNLCKRCGSTRAIISYHKNKPTRIRYQKKRQVEKDYNITLEEYEDIMNSAISCNLCGRTDKKLCYDHDHETMKFRGVLCNSCNSSLGKFGDNVAGMERVIKYLKKEETWRRNANL